METITEGLKKLLLAGVGATAATAEKAENLVKDLVKKGELTIEQGKVLNEELKHNIKDRFDTHKDDSAKKAAEDPEGFVKDLSEDEKAALLKALQGEEK